MGLFQNLRDKYITTPVANRVLEKVQQPAELPVGMESWNVPLNFNNQYFLKVKPGASVTYDTLRNMSRFYEVARSCITIKQNQITQLDWNIINAASDDETDYSSITEPLKQWIQDMAGTVKFSKFLKQVIEDMLVIDGVALYKKRDLGGRLQGVVSIDPAIIKLRVDAAGLTPQAPDIAFEEWIRGTKRAEMTTDDMYYHISNPRTDSPYGFSVLESLLITVESYLKVGMYNLSYFTDGTMPEGFYGLPPEYNLSQIKAFVEQFDAMQAGDPKNQRKIKFMPSGGDGFKPSKSFEFINIQPFMEWMMRLTASAFGVMPQELGFTEKVNRSSSEEQTEISKRNSVKALAFDIEELINDFIWNNELILPNGQVIKPTEAIKFSFMNLDPRDELIDSQIAEKNVTTGLISIDDWRKDHGMKLIGVDPFIVTTQGIVMIKDIAAGNLPSTNPPADVKEKPAVDESKSTPKEDLKLWEKKALNDLKLGQSFRKFDSEVLDDYTKVHLEEDLRHCTDKQEIRDCFAKWQKATDEGVVRDVERLYKKLDEILES